ncbi:MAG TPA: TonB-dependent receptor [Candidatus Binataceae bacterium]|nr:TonB-dependent receptor [Candidatus Binataceae bacterium]
MKALFIRLAAALGEIGFARGKAASRLWCWWRPIVEASAIVAAAGVVIVALTVNCLAGSRPITGTVTDSLGRPLANAAIELRSANGAIMLRTVTDNSGRFSFEPLHSGLYSLVAAKRGFEPANEIVSYPSRQGGSITIALGAETALTVPVEATVIRGPNGVSSTGANKYTITAQDIQNLPRGENTTITDVLEQMPGVAIDQNQQIHIRNTEGPQFQYQINGVMVPLDINTNPPFISMINPIFIQRLSLLDGILPSRYSYATGGVVSIETKDGCEQPGGSFSMYGGQRNTVQPSFQYGGCAGKFSYYLTGLYSQSNTAFSSATPAPDAIHDHTNQGQGFGFFSYDINPTTRLSLITSASASENQLPNQANLIPEFTLPGENGYPSADIDSYLNFHDYLGILALNGAPAPGLTYQLAYAAHYISQKYEPDNTGELLYQGVAATAFHSDVDNTLEGDLTYQLGHHTLGTGFYLGEYGVESDSNTLVFPVNSAGVQDGPVERIINNSNKINLLSGIYLQDTWQLTEKLRANFGVRWDRLSGFTYQNQIDPTINFMYLLRPDTTLHAGFARYMQVPSFQGISPGAPEAFAGTSGFSGTGTVNPDTEDDLEWDAGIVHQLTKHITISEDAFYEYTHHYLDTGQFGVVPIFAPFNYFHGYIWSTETAITYTAKDLSIHASSTIGRNMQTGVATGQFNFDPIELGYIDRHYIVLDHQPLYGATGGITYNWNPWSFSLDTLYSSGLRGGFADLESLPHVAQTDLSAQRGFDVPHIGQVTDRITLLNIFDRTNLIRPAEGIGIFQAAYGPRITVYDTLTIPLPALSK